MIPSRVARRALPRAALRASALHHQRPAVALFIPLQLRHLSTNPHAAGPGAPGAPPPGFDSEKAKKPLSADGKSQQNSKDKSAAQAKTTEVLKKAVEEGASKPTSLVDLVEEKKAQAIPHNVGTAELKEAIKREEKKLTLGQKIWKEVIHYWDGTKLLAAEVKISSRLALKMAAGYELTRRENRQLQRTVQDLGRLVPFSVFVIVPFAELLLPVALKLFPNMLPSTYEGEKSRNKKKEVLRATRNDVSAYLRQTLKETGLPVTAAMAQKEGFTEFFRKLRATGEQPTTEDVIKVCKAFRDDLTLDNLSRPQIVSMLRYLNLSTFGTDTMLRYQVRHRMRQIKRDDRAISFEGVDSLDVSELQMACASRGIRTQATSPARLREDLQTWLDLRLKHGVPSTLLVLSNAYMYADSRSNSEEGLAGQIAALTNVLSAIPEELLHEIELEVNTADGAATNKQRLEVLKEQQEMIEEENEQNEQNQSSGIATPRDTEDIDEKEDRVEAAAPDLTADEKVVIRSQSAEAVESEKEGIKAVLNEEPSVVAGKATEAKKSD